MRIPKWLFVGLVLCLGMSVGAVAVLWLGPRRSTIQASRFEVVDPDGNVCASLGLTESGAPCLLLERLDTQTMVALGFPEVGAAGLVIHAPVAGASVLVALDKGRGIMQVEHHEKIVWKTP